MNRCLLVVSLLLAPASARSHELWVEPAGEGFVLRSGHQGGELLPLDAARVKGLRCASGGAPPADVRDKLGASGPELRIAARCEAVSAVLHPQLHSLTPDGEVSGGKDEVPDAVKSWESRQYAKWLDPGARGADRPLGDELEIILVGEHTRARVGEKVTLRVLHDGAPLAGATVTIGHRAIGETDRAGEARVKLRAAGTASVSASIRRPLPTPRADTIMLEASLTFPVAR